MIMRNGKTPAGWRMDEVNESSPSGLGMLMNPFAIVPQQENAERIETAFEILGDVKKLQEIEDRQALGARLMDWFDRNKANVDKVVGKS